MCRTQRALKKIALLHGLLFLPTNYSKQLTHLLKSALTSLSILFRLLKAQLGKEEFLQSYPIEALAYRQISFSQWFL